ncbi:hypothetical protein [Streptomyces blattellae]|uniref:hypothetical protein n=1 Tax=Streptomyces blattellae TaxID=2569855 RepID=UPI0012B900F9|nr:hypothetical protein [Streptomyces blattellae]
MTKDFDHPLIGPVAVNGDGPDRRVVILTGTPGTPGTPGSTAEEALRPPPVAGTRRLDVPG